MRVHLSTRGHRRTEPFWGDPEFRGQLLGLWFVAVERYAARTGDVVHLGPDAVQWVTGKRRNDRARAALNDLCERMDYPILWTDGTQGVAATSAELPPNFDRTLSERCGNVAVILVRNLAEKQGLHSATPQRLSLSQKSDSDSPHTPPSGGRRKGRREPVEGPPIELAAHLRQRLADVNPSAKGARDTDLQPSARIFDLILRRDERPEAEVREVIDFALNDPFWQAVIQSARGLRKHYDKVNTKRLQRGNSKGRPTVPVDEWERRRRESEADRDF